MKSLLLTCMMLLALIPFAQAQTWNGSVNNVWTNPLNWTPNTVPNATSNITLNGSGFSPKLQGNTSVGAISSATGVTLDFNGFSLTVGGLNAFTTIGGAILINSNAGTDIIINLNQGAGGYYTYFTGSTVNDKITFNITGVDPFYEGAVANTFNGDVVMNVNGTLPVYTSYTAISQFNGNFNYNRTVGGSNYIFNQGANVTGNVNIQNTSGGLMNIGYTGANSTINGTVTINVSDPGPASFVMTRLKNLTTGGTINVQNTLAFTIQNDSLKVASMTVQGYEGNAYAYLIANMIEGNVIIEDDIAYSSGWDTRVNNNLITGNSSFTQKGTNNFFESSAINTANVYNGNTIFNLNSAGSLYLCQADKSTFNGNLTINRTVGGYTRAFNLGATINGNFTYNNSASGANDLGNVANKTAISGTVNMNVNLAPIAGFQMHRLVNLTPGGKINVQNSTGFDVQQDSLKVDSLNILYYRGNAYGYFYDNEVIGNLTLADSLSFSSGWDTRVKNNSITGNTTFKLYGTNTFYEAITLANTYTGNLAISILSGASVFTSYNAKSTVTGNYTVNRTVAGYTRLFADGATIGGNFSYTKNAAGASDLGLLGNKTSIGGTINLNVTQTTADDFSMHRIQNLTNGGSVVVQNTKAPNIQQDSLLTTSFSITGYGGNQYAFVNNNQITGNFILQDVATYSGGYNTQIQNNTFNGNSVITLLGTNLLYEASAGGLPNTFNGNVTFNADGSGSLYVSHFAKSIFNGNLIVNRTIAGYTRLFNFGATINGNFSFTKDNPGASDLGQISNKTTISGTINMNVTQTTGDDFSMHRIQNLTNGGSIAIQNTEAPSIRQDSLLTTAFSVTGYGGGNYAYFFNNQITGNLTWQDVTSYGGGYNTQIQNNTITGNSVFTILGSNVFTEASAASAPDLFNGNVTFNGSGTGALYISHDAKSTFNGSLTINRTVGGITKAFNFGANVNGNLSYTKSIGGASEFGHISRKTAITGTVNMAVTQSTSDPFEMYWLVNGTTGGTINIQDTRAFDFQKDSLKLVGLTINGYSGSAYTYFYNNQIEGNFTTSDNASYSGGYASYYRNNTVFGTASITINGLNVFNDGDAAASGNTYLGNITYTRNGGIMNIGTVDTNSYAGNFVLNNSSALPINTELIKFIGSTNTNIDQLGTGTVAIQKFILNKSSAARVTINKPVRVTTSFTFVTGYINSTLSNSLIFPDNITHTGAADNSHVVGCVTKAGNDAFAFPLGNGIGYHPLSISAPAAITDSFQACIILNHPNDDGYNVNSKDASLVQIAPYHYWTLNQISGANSEAVTLGWSNPCVNAGITNLPGMVVARWNSIAGPQWNNLGNSATTGTASFGSVTQTGTTANYGAFALATTSALNAWQITSVTATASIVCDGTPTTLNAAGASTYTWMPGNLSGSSVIVTPSTTTTYTVTGTSATGCITTATKTITVNPLPPTGTTTSSTAICIGSSVTITGTGANTYTWMPGSLSGSSITVSPTSTTTYTVTGTFTATGCTKTATRLVTVNPLPTVGTTVTNATICNGTSTSITGTGANTYSWNPGGLTGTTVNVSPATTTTYTVTGTNTATGCTNTSTRTITVNPLPTVGTTVTNATVCAGTSTSITGTGANTYTWNPGGLSGTTVTVTPATTTTYTVTGTTTATGCTNTALRTITVNPLPTVGTTVTNATICNGTSTSITGTGANTYTWNPGGLSGTTVTVSPATTTTYSVTGTTTATGCTNTALRTITVNSLPTVGTTVTNATVCAGTSTSITGTGANTYTWNPGGLSGTTVTVTPATTTTYTVTGTNTTTGCTNTSTRTITVNPLPTVGTTVTNATVCAGTSTSITGTGANTYTWNPGGLSGTTVTVTPASTTTYTVTGTTTATGCTKTATRIITVNPLPTVGTTVTNATICAGSSTSITGTGANTYTWNPGGLSGTTVTVTPATTTTYTVTGTTTATGCTKTATRTITVTNCNTTVNLKLFIEGFYIGPSLMTPVLFNQGVSLNTSVVDSILVQLRHTTAPYAVVATTKAVLNVNGTASAVFTPSVTGTYYIAIQHRNAVQTWSSAGVAVGPSPVSYDFSNAITKAFGNNMKLISTSPNVYGFYTGDVNQDENADVIDLSFIENDITLFSFGYIATDINGDGNVDILDTPVVETNVNNFVFSSHP